MVYDLKHLRVLFKELIDILEKENDRDTLYIIHQLGLGLHLINQCLNSSYENDDLIDLYSKLEEIYARINQPRVGLSDYYIWKENYEERIKANMRLDIIKEGLSSIFN